MNQRGIPLLDDSIYTANFAALSQVDPVLVERLVEFSSEMQAAVPAVTRDGQVSFQLSLPDSLTENGKTADLPDMRIAESSAKWFGRTSIPSVRAAALLDRFDVGQANVLLPGIGQGFEVTLLLGRLGDHRAVFVWESDPRWIFLALRLHDWAVAISQHRLVILTGPLERLTSILRAWLKEHVGHICPDRILMWPWATSVELAAVRSAVQDAYTVTEQERREQLDALRNRRPPVLPRADTSVGNKVTCPGPFMAILSLQARSEIWALHDAMALAAGNAGCKVVCSSVRNPGDVHSLVRARRMAELTAEQPPQWALLLEVARQDLRDVLPDATPAISWLAAQTISSVSLPDRLGSRDLVAVTDSRGYDWARRAGIPPERLLVVSRPCLFTAENLDDSPDFSGRPVDVTIVANLASLRPEVYGYHLPTHQQLWNEAMALISAGIESFTEDSGESLFIKTEQKLKIRLEDATVRQAMIRNLSGPVADSLLWRFLVRHLSQGPHKLAVYGQGWGDVDNGFWRGIVSGVTDLRQACHHTKVILHANVTGEVSGVILAAAASGAIVVSRKHPRDNLAGGLATLLRPDREMIQGTRLATLVSAIHQLCGNPSIHGEISRQAWSRCITDHTPTACFKTFQAAASSCFGG